MAQPYLDTSQLVTMKGICIKREITNFKKILMVFNPRLQLIVFGVIAIVWACLSTQLILYKSILGVRQLDNYITGWNAAYVYMGVEGIITSFIQTVAVTCVVIGSFSSMIDLKRTQIFAKLMLTFSYFALLLCVALSIVSSILDPMNSKLVLDIVSAIVYGLFSFYIAVYRIILHLYEVREDEEEGREILDEVFVRELDRETKI